MSNRQIILLNQLLSKQPLLKRLLSNKGQLRDFQKAICLSVPGIAGLEFPPTSFFPCLLFLSSFFFFVIAAVVVVVAVVVEVVAVEVVLGVVVW